MIIHDAFGPFVVGVTADLFRSVLCLMVFRLCLAECRLQLAPIGHDPNPPPEGRQRETAITLVATAALRPSVSLSPPSWTLDLCCQSLASQTVTMETSRSFKQLA